MKPAPFRYVAPSTLEEALAVLAEHGDEASLLAGGQSLVPLMNLRLARPSVVIDVGRVAELTGVRNGDDLRIGTTTTQALALAEPAVARGAALLTDALREVGTPATRSRGTVGGSLTHADPAAELPAAMLALAASITVASTRGSRTIAAAELCTGPFTTSLAPDEILTEIRIPKASEARRHGFAELARRRGDFALTGVCCTATAAGGVFHEPRIALFGVNPKPIRAPEAEAALEGAALDDESAIAAAAELAAAACEPASDVHASATYRRRVSIVVVRRAISQMGACD